jgi:hypothetical protein
MKRHVFDLRPTQFAVGMYEVEKKMKKLMGFKQKELEEYLDAHPVPIVLCPDGQCHVIDHHHLVRACWEAGIEKVVTHVEEDLSQLDSKAFWEEMIRRKWVHLYDQFGRGPHDPGVLPMNVRGLADDLFRSLAWAIREEGGYQKTPVPFCEFKWADFFRKKLKVERTEDGFKTAVDEALKLARSEEASHLPGYVAKKGS